jgi:hypothetical protein
VLVYVIYGLCGRDNKVKDEKTQRSRDFLHFVGEGGGVVDEVLLNGGTEVRQTVDTGLDGAYLIVHSILLKVLHTTSLLQSDTVALRLYGIPLLFVGNTREFQKNGA